MSVPHFDRMEFDDDELGSLWDSIADDEAFEAYNAEPLYEAFTDDVAQRLKAAIMRQQREMLE